MIIGIGLMCIIIGLFILLMLVSDAFKQGIEWGLLCLLFPPGTYFYCKHHWKVAKTNVIAASIFLGVGVLLYGAHYFKLS